MDKMRALQKLKSLADSRPKIVSSGRVAGDRDGPARRSMRCPIMTLLAAGRRPVHHPAGGDHARIPQTARRNVGMYRVQVFDAHDDGDALADPQGRGAPTGAAMGERMDVAIALGLDPVTAYSASAPLPKHIDEFMMAGFLRGSPGRARARRGPSTSRCRRAPRS